MDKKTAEILRQKMIETESEPGFVRGRAMVAPKNKTEVIKKRLCTKVIDFHLANKQIKKAELAEILDVNPSTLSFILNYHLDKVSIDSLIKCLEALSSKDQSINETLKRIAIA